MAVTPFGVALKAHRCKRRLSQNDLAMAVGVHPTYIGKLERGTSRGPSANLVCKLAGALDLDDQDLLRLSGKVARKDLVAEIARLRQRVEELEHQVLAMGGTLVEAR